MISNRQSRRRGRGGQRNQPGNRQDNRQRGNAAQLLEKYKGLARDAQMSGDRVQAEYYLQFADHYFRVLEEHRSQKEEQQAQRQDRQQDDGGDHKGKPKKDAKESGEEKPRRTRKAPSEDKPRKSKANGAKHDDGEGGGIAADALPPAIGDDEAKKDAPKPRRRRSADDGDTASAA